MADIVQVLDTAEIHRILASPSGPVARDLLRRGYRVEAAIKARCPVDHGRLRSSYTTQLAVGGVGGAPFRVVVGTNVDYAMFVEKGTGLYGPRHARIYPVRAKVMVFTPRTRGPGGALIPRAQRTVVFARSTRGMPAQPHIAPGFAAGYAP